MNSSGLSNIFGGGGGEEETGEASGDQQVEIYGEGEGAGLGRPGMQAGVSESFRS